MALSLEAALSKSLLFPEGKREVARRSRDGGIDIPQSASLPAPLWQKGSLLDSGTTV